MRNLPLNKRRRKSSNNIAIHKFIIFICGLIIGSVATAITITHLSSKADLARHKTPTTKSTNKAKIATSNSSINNCNDQPIQTNQNKVQNKYDFYSLLPKDHQTNRAEQTTDVAKSTTLTPNPKKIKYLVLIGTTFNNNKQADELKASLALYGFEATIKPTTTPKQPTSYQVTLGPFNNIKTATAKQQQLLANGFKQTSILKK